MKRQFFFALSALILGFPALVAADVETLMQDCNGCHGDNGVSQWKDMPSIAGLAEFVHVDALYVYQDEARPCAESKYRQGDTSRPATTMCAIAADLSEDDIDELAAAYAELPYVAVTQEFDADFAAAGEAVHSKLCEKCHSDAGMNPEDEAGMLGGQQMGYLRNSFEEFAAGDRDQPKKMKEKLNQLTADETEALVHYYGSQQ